MKRTWYNSTSYDNHPDDGFSLLELVVAVSIMLILGTTGFVSYQSYTENARQASVDSAARQVLTSTLASIENPSGEAPEETVYQYNRTTDDMTANITAATADELTITVTDRKGTAGTATVSGNYENIPATEYSTDGAVFEWAGEPHASESLKIVDGEEVSRNLIVNPRITDGDHWYSMLNETIWGGWENGHGAALQYTEEIPTYSGGNTDNPVMATGEPRSGIVGYPVTDLPPGEYTVSFDAERGVPGGPVRVILWDSESGLTAKNATMVDGKHRYVIHLDHDYPIKRVYLDFRQNEDRVIGNTIGYFDKVLLESGHTEGKYFDGDSR